MKNFLCLIKDFKQKIYFEFFKSKKAFFVFLFIFFTLVFVFSLVSIFVIYNGGGKFFKTRKGGEGSGFFDKNIINVSFDNESGFIISKSGLPDIDFNKLAFFDKYYSLEWDIVFPENCYAFFDKKFFAVDNDFIDSAYIENNDEGKTVLHIVEKDIFGMDISYDENCVKLCLKNPKEVYENIVVIDPAHGGMDFGVNNGKFFEKDITLKICKKIEEMFRNSNRVKIYLTRNSDDYLKNEERIFFANQYADIFLSVNISSRDEYNFSDRSEMRCYGYDKFYGDSPEKCARLLRESISKYVFFKNPKIILEDKAVDGIEVLSFFIEFGFDENNDYFNSLPDRCAAGIYDGINKIFE